MQLGLRMFEIKVYTVANCPYCIALEKFLDGHNIRFRNIDVSQNKEVREEIIHKSGQTGVPVAEINGKVVVGFDRERIIQLLNIKD